MSCIEHIIEPNRLLLSWQTPEGKDRRRYIVAELCRRGDDADLIYLCCTPDYEAAKAKGFAGDYPGFPLGKEHPNVLAAFMRRLPPRRRTDFGQFLEAIRIPSDAEISDFALLGYAGARLPSDDFSIIHPFDDAKPPFEFLLPVAGYRYYTEHVPRESLKMGMMARFEFEPGNTNDPDAVKIVIPDVSEDTAGYVCRGLLPQFRQWMLSGMAVEGMIDRINGTGDRPLVHLFVTVREAASSIKSDVLTAKASS